MATATLVETLAELQDQFDISTKEGKNYFARIEHEWENQEYLIYPKEFILGKSPIMKFNEYSLMEASSYHNGFVLLSPAGRLYLGTFRVRPDKFFYTQLKEFIYKVSPPGAIVVQTTKKLLKDNKLKRMVLINADDDNEMESLVDEFDNLGVPATSFRCMQRFYEGNEALDRISEGKLMMFDFTSDTYKNLSVTDKKLLSENKTPKPPEPGFSLVGSGAGQRWHRSGTVLLQDKERNFCILMGQDEGTYFGVQLPKMVRTVAEAFESLVPKEVTGQKYQRQGEWFMVPVDEKDVPTLTECSAYSEDTLVLPIETADSNYHYLAADEIRVGFDGYVYAQNVNLTHDEHQSLRGIGWHVFYKNTAVRSFSEQGVD